MPALIDRFDLAGALPPAYRAYVPLLREGLAYFLARLPVQRIDAMVRAQLTLDTADPAVRLVELLRACPVLHKLGQVLAHEQRLDGALRSELQRLESLPSEISGADLEKHVRRHFRVPGRLELGAPLAEASVAVVVPFRLARRGRATRAGVLKLLRSGVRRRLREELAVWPALGAFLERRAAELGLPALDYRGTLEIVRRLLSNEVRLDLEQRHLRTAGELYGESSTVYVPRVLPGSTPQLTVMERVDGAKVTEAELTPENRRRVARLLLEELVVHPLLRARRSALVHGDPHAGNLFLTPDGRIAVLDWSLAAELGLAERRGLVSLVLWGLSQDERRLRRTLAELARLDPAAAPLRAVAARGLWQIRHGTLPGFDWALALLDALAREGQPRFSASLTLFRKAVYMLGGVARTLDPELEVGARVTAAVLTRATLPLLRADPNALPLGVPTWVELGPELAGALGLAPARYWLEGCRDLLNAYTHGTAPTATSPARAREPSRCGRRYFHELGSRRTTTG